MKCPTCGADNDQANRFCDQCGTRLDAPPAAAAPPAVIAAQQPTAAAPTCPRCGSVVLPGEAFCDECGAPLGTAVAPLLADAPTVLSAAPPSATLADGATCPQCGTLNAPGDRFCDNCGAALTGQAPTTATPAPAQSEPAQLSSAAAPVIPADPPASHAADATVFAPPVDPNDIPTVVPEDPPPTLPEVVAPVEPAPVALEPEPTPAPAPEPTPAATQAPTAADLDAQVAYEAQRAQLEAELARQQQVVSQLESVQAALGAATPAGVVQSLDEARAGLTRTQAELSALQPPPPPAPAIDPAELARLEAELARQQQVVSQLESVQTALGAATPAGVVQSLDEARAGLTRTQAELSALTGTGGAPTPAPTPAPAPAPASVASQPVGPTDQTVLAPPANQVPPPPPPLPAGPRLLFEESGAEITLPTDRSEIIIGREDPISGIHPEVDMTPFGGESGGVSRQHARINHDGGQWTITDLNSTNYTRVDGVKLDPNVAAPLHDGARLQFGRVSLTFKS